jgi:hypothetical protein
MAWVTACGARRSFHQNRMIQRDPRHQVRPLARLSYTWPHFRAAAEGCEQDVAGLDD